MSQWAVHDLSSRDRVCGWLLQTGASLQDWSQGGAYAHNLFAGYALFLPAMLAVFIGHAYPNETLTLSLVLGGSLILLANVATQWKGKPHRPGIAPAP